MRRGAFDRRAVARGESLAESRAKIVVPTEAAWEERVSFRRCQLERRFRDGVDANLRAVAMREGRGNLDVEAVAAVAHAMGGEIVSPQIRRSLADKNIVGEYIDEHASARMRGIIGPAMDDAVVKTIQPPDNVEIARRKAEREAKQRERTALEDAHARHSTPMCKMKSSVSPGRACAIPGFWSSSPTKSTGES